MTMKMGMDFNLKDIIGQGSNESNDVQTNLLHWFVKFTIILTRTRRPVVGCPTLLK